MSALVMIATKAVSRLIRKETTIFRELKATRNIITKASKGELSAEEINLFKGALDKASSKEEEDEIRSVRQSLMEQQKIGITEAIKREIDFKLNRLTEPSYWGNILKGQALGNAGGDIFAIQRTIRYIELLHQMWDEVQSGNYTSAGKIKGMTKAKKVTSDPRGIGQGVERGSVSTKNSNKDIIPDYAELLPQNNFNVSTAVGINEDGAGNRLLELL